MAMAMSARCSTARRIEVCRGAVSLPRSLSFRQSWRSAPPLRWLGPYISAIAAESGCVAVADRTSGPRPAGCITVSAATSKSAPAQRADGVVERHLQRRRPDDQDHQRADEPAHRQPEQASGPGPRR